MDTIWTNGIVDLYQGDCREVLQSLPAQSVHCVVTSPPYWGLRDYGTAPNIWGAEASCMHDFTPESYQRRSADTGNGEKQTSNAGANQRDVPVHHATCRLCGAWSGELGLQPTPELYVQHIVDVFREVWRVLRDDGTLWLNLGDSYARQAGDDSKKETDSGIKTGRTGKSQLLFKPGNNTPPIGLKPKDLVGIPWRVAFALQADGWYLRSDIIWQKPNPMPESVTDRPTKSHEYLFLLTKAQRYYYDADAIREEGQGHKWSSSSGFSEDGQAKLGGAVGHTNGKRFHSAEVRTGRNKRTVWTIATQSFPDAHFATFPEKLVEPCILAGCPENGIVLDPFIGSGTTAIVAQHLGRRCIGIDASETYLKDIALKRITSVSLPMPID